MWLPRSPTPVLDWQAVNPWKQIGQAGPTSPRERPVHFCWTSREHLPASCSNFWVCLGRHLLRNATPEYRWVKGRCYDWCPWWEQISAEVAKSESLVSSVFSISRAADLFHIINELCSSPTCQAHSAGVNNERKPDVSGSSLSDSVMLTIQYIRTNVSSFQYVNSSDLICINYSQWNTSAPL